ncbi:hypothetical protein ACUSIJ_21975 [Pseudochelatococcus sp. B33]
MVCYKRQTMWRKVSWRMAVWYTLSRMRLLPALLVAVALFVAPLAHAMPVPCHSQTVQVPAQDGVGNQHQAAVSVHKIHTGNGQLHAADYKVCCSFACGVCAVVAGAADASTFVPASVRQYYGWADQISLGLSVLPLLTPPRSMV